MPRGSDIAESTLPLGAVLFKVTAGSTLKAVPVVKSPGMMSLVSRGGGHGQRLVSDGDGTGIGLGKGRLSRHCRKDG